MTKGAAVLAIGIALALGWYGAHWWLAEKDEISAKNRHNNALKVMWAARRVLGVVVVIGAVLTDLWFKGRGR